MYSCAIISLHIYARPYRVNFLTFCIIMRRNGRREDVLSRKSQLKDTSVPPPAMIESSTVLSFGLTTEWMERGRTEADGCSDKRRQQRAVQYTRPPTSCYHQQFGPQVSLEFFAFLFERGSVNSSCNKLLSSCQRKSATLFTHRRAHAENERSENLVFRESCVSVSRRKSIFDPSTRLYTIPIDSSQFFCVNSFRMRLSKFHEPEERNTCSRKEALCNWVCHGLLRVETSFPIAIIVSGSHRSMSWIVIMLCIIMLCCNGRIFNRGNQVASAVHLTQFFPLRFALAEHFLHRLAVR